jgi:hypothetical protein
MSRKDEGPVAGETFRKIVKTAAVVMLALSLCSYFFLLLFPNVFYLPPLVGNTYNRDQSLQSWVMMLTALSLFGPALSVGALSLLWATAPDDRDKGGMVFRVFIGLLAPFAAFTISYIAMGMTFFVGSVL